jgi:hypothetical protein
MSVEVGRREAACMHRCGGTAWGPCLSHPSSIRILPQINAVPNGRSLLVFLPKSCTAPFFDSRYLGASDDTNSFVASTAAVNPLMLNWFITKKAPTPRVGAIAT